MKIREMMRKKFVSFQSDDRLIYILKVFAKNNIRSAPVFEDEQLIGIINITNIIESVSPKQFGFFHNGKVLPISKLKKIIAGSMAKKPRIILKPEQELKGAVRKIMNEKACIPVINKKKIMVGLVRPEDLVEVLLGEFVKGKWLKPDKKVYEAKKGGRRVQTDIDKILDIVERKRWTPVRKIAEELGMSVKTAEELGEILHEHHLVRLKYTFLGGAELGRIRKECKEKAQGECK